MLKKTEGMDNPETLDEDKQNKNITRHPFDTTMRKQTQIM